MTVTQLKKLLVFAHNNVAHAQRLHAEIAPLLDENENDLERLALVQNVDAAAEAFSLVCDIVADEGYEWETMLEVALDEL